MKELTDKIVEAVRKQVPGVDPTYYVDKRKGILTFLAGEHDVIKVYRSGKVIIDTTGTFRENEVLI